MAFPGTGKIWMNGKLVEWKDATIHIASHVIHYGSGASRALSRTCRSCAAATPASTSDDGVFGVRRTRCRSASLAASTSSSKSPAR